MAQSLRKLSGIFVAFFISTVANAGWDDYKPYTLAAVIAEQPHPSTADYRTTAGDFPYLVNVGFTGQRRPLLPQKRRVIEQWVKSLRLNPGALSLYEEEFGFLEAGVTYWLPVQQQLISHFAKELKTGDTIRLYVVWIGSTKSESVFLVNEFQK